MKKKSLYLLFVSTLACTVYLWWSGSSGLFLQAGNRNLSLIAVGRLCGLLLETGILMQLVFMGRVRWIEQQFGHDKLNRIHRTLGKYLSILLVLHPFLITTGYAHYTGSGFFGQFWEFLTTWDHVLKAFSGLIILAIVIATSVFLRGRIRYEFWYFTHFSVYAAIALAFFHQTRFGDFAGRPGAIVYWYVLNFGVFGLILGYRFVRPLYLFVIHDFRVERVVVENYNTYSVHIGGRDLARFHFLPGQFANLFFLQRGLLFSHPFSFSAAPNGQSLRFSIKAEGDFTSRVSKLRPGARVLIDGPLGVFTEKTAHVDKFLFVAGGIGITPIRSLVESLAQKNKDLVLLYANRTPEDAVFGRELATIAARQHYVFSNILEQETPGYEKGRIDREKIARLVPDVLEREAFICGPPPMMEAVAKTLQSLGMSRERIHFEKFSY